MVYAFFYIIISLGAIQALQAIGVTGLRGVRGSRAARMLRVLRVSRLPRVSRVSECLGLINICVTIAAGFPGILFSDKARGQQIYF